MKNISDRDKKHIWHPLTQHKLHPDAIAITRAKGAVLYDEENKEYIDGIASWYTCMYGHCNDHIIRKAHAQMQRLDHVVFSGFTHDVAVELSEALMEILPQNQQKLFFSDNGSTASDVAIKMALQYHFNRGKKKNILVAFEEGFHGDTFGAMSVSGLSVYNGPFEDFFLTVERIPVPTGENNEEVLEKLRRIISEDNVAGFIYEPLVQGAAAMKMHDREGLNALIGLCKENDVITIADEVMTGFGKTGKNFASEYMDNQPDIISMSKALTAGMLPMAITSCTRKVYDAFYSDDISKGLFHGHTYSATPLACSVALAGIELLRSEEMQQNLQRVMESHREFDKRVRNHHKVAATRQLGVIYALDLNIQMERYGNLRDKLFRFFMDNGVFLRPLGNTIYILPPYVVTGEQLQKIYDSIERALDEVV
ncbi:adenosylmethionine--8-amino-7-oxononanoate transaminase [Sinomicrobium weinanense]|uniref:Adenosylmethionine-8-amino-7-oxononanoate aminotransferase n=1 Tax=Sinomicrobium weinanense TaxID=2842200 RepID=A0A926JNM0_9FLAO|nr:adenosylmethionine--8-amino-7-oxononanoate transaminase [Sinomicrobium weinanense]MBC9794436.1 adenosylmethionine--8-amino-7-oxononanoate transaminase [Sinomicrobium weinanense]MBU3124343.1 adenosylmethionine--8-amino-7-oxononanoate transaminase [Sinomicrobium weinanense]